MTAFRMMVGLVAAVVCLASMNAQAVLVRDGGINGTTLFYDDFEDSVNASTSVPEIGTWTVSAGADQMLDQNVGFPGPNPSSGGLGWGDYPNINGNPRARANLTSPITGTAYAAAALFIGEGEPASERFGWRMRFETAAGGEAVDITFERIGDGFGGFLPTTKQIQERSEGGGGAENVPGFTFELGDWVVVETQYTVGTTVADIWVQNGTTGGPRVHHVVSVLGTNDPITRLTIGNGGSFTSIFIDDIPEPASLSLLALGLVAIARRRR